MTKCDKLWLKINGRIVGGLIVTLPIALLMPEIAIVTIGSGLFISCRSFLTFGSISNDNDSLRFIITMPFSRRQIFDTYVKGMIFLSAGYITIIALFRYLLLLFNFKYSIGFIDIFTTSDLIKYLMILFLFSLIISIFQVSIIKNYSQSKFSTFILVSIFIAFPGLFILYYFKPVIMFFRLPLEISNILTIIIYSGLILGFIVLLIKELKNSKKRFCGEG